jgi:hypothetical protein
MKNKKNKVNFLMDTDWVFQGGIDSEQKKYELLSYFQKLNRNLEEFKLYPMFTELSLHLGNIQTLINKNQILYTEKKLKTTDEELLLSDLKLKDIPVLNDDEYKEYQKILIYSQPKLFDYFNITKSLWMIVSENIRINIKKNKKNIGNRSGFFYYQTNDKIYVWKYENKKVRKIENQYSTKLTLIYEDEIKKLTLSEIISIFSKTYDLKNEKNNPVFEIVCKNEQIFPLNETLLPIFKRKIMAYITQSKKQVKEVESGVQ